jgi:hypothetical protein
MTEENKLTIYENGEPVEIEVLDIFKLDNYPEKDYILYTKGETDGEFEKTYVSIIVDTEEEVIFEAIEDEEELKAAETYIYSVSEETGDE